MEHPKWQNTLFWPLHGGLFVLFWVLAPEAEFPGSRFLSPNSNSRDHQGLKFESNLRPRRVPNRELRCFESESPFYCTKSWSKNVRILWFLPSPSKFRFRIRFRVYDDLKIESDSETVTSPEPRVSVFRVRDEGLGKFCPEATFWKFKILQLPMLTLRSKQTIKQGIKKTKARNWCGLLRSILS